MHPQSGYDHQSPALNNGWHCFLFFYFHHSLPAHFHQSSLNGRVLLCSPTPRVNVSVKLVFKEQSLHPTSAIDLNKAILDWIVIPILINCYVIFANTNSAVALTILLGSNRSINQIACVQDNRISTNNTLAICV